MRKIWEYEMQKSISRQQTFASVYPIMWNKCESFKRVFSVQFPFFPQSPLKEFNASKVINRIHMRLWSCKREFAEVKWKFWNWLVVLSLIVAILKNVWNNIFFVKNGQDILEKDKHNLYLQNKRYKGKEL